MSRPKVYIETTIIGFLTARPSRDIVTQSKQQLTHEWWNEERSGFDLFCSPLVVREVSQGHPDAAKERLEELSGIPVLDLAVEAKNLAQKIIGPGMIPPIYYEDALHVALATVHGMDYLLTWNLNHIANATLRKKYEQEIRKEGYEPPLICTPEELMRSEP